MIFVNSMIDMIVLIRGYGWWQHCKDVRRTSRGYMVI